MPPTLHLRTSVLDGAGFVFSPPTDTWRRSIRSNGGYWIGQFSMTGSIGELINAFYNWTGFHLEEYTAGGISWEGMIYEMELSHGGVRRRRSLDLMSNYISIYWVDPARVEHQTSWASNDQSIARHGRKEEIDWLDDMTQPAAEAQRDRMVNELAWPWARPVSVSTAGDTILTVTACGYAFTANWRYTTQNTEYDTEQGALTYAATTFTDAGQDFNDWETAAPGTAQHSIWITNGDNTLTWAYLGADTGGTQVNVYTDQGLTVAGWNGTDPIAGGQTPVSYYVRGGVSELISDIVSNDSEFLTAGSIDTNYVQVNRILQRDQRCWDVMMDAVDLGDTDGDPYRLYVTANRRINYKEIPTTPQYYLRDNGVYNSVGASTTESPWLVQPGIFRDLTYAAPSQAQYGSWLTDARDIYVEEVEVDADGSLTLKTDLFSEGELLAAQVKAMQRYPQRPRPETKK